MPCRLRFCTGALLCSLVGCFTPETPNTDPTDTDSDGTSAGPTTDDPTTTSISATNDPTMPSTSGSPTTTPTSEESGSSGPGAVCGDGEVNGDEVCDDGVNDGSYGGCTADCGAQADHCGDTTINGPEVCDDGVNDNSYGGCNTDCTALGPYCGDGMVQNAQEMCDNGAANENGSGCNIDCVVSGTEVHEYVSDPLELCAEPTPPVFRADDSVLIAYGGCGNTWTLLELSPELEEVAATDVLLAGYPYRATMRGTDWLMADWECNWIVAEDGELTEICDDTRNTGVDSIHGVDDEIYIAMKNGALAQFGAGSPAVGDSPDWTGVGNSDSPGNSFYDTWRATTGALGSVVSSGQSGYYNGSSWTYYAYIERFNSTGMFLTSRTYYPWTYFDNIQSNADGVIVLLGWNDETDTQNLMRLNANLNPSWDIEACTNYGNEFVVDSAEHVVIECTGEYPNRYVRKLDAGGDELWAFDLEFEFDPTYGKLGVDSTDHIVRVAYEYDSLAMSYQIRVEKFAP
jgi:hypothetical protein